MFENSQVTSNNLHQIAETIHFKAAIVHTGNGGLRIGIILRAEPLLSMAIED